MFTWIAILVASIIVYLAVARQTGFRILTSSNGESRFGSLKGLLSSSDSKDGEGLGSAIWKKVYANKDDDGKKLTLYIIAILLAYAAYHIAPVGKEYVFRCVAALIVMHFIWTFSPGKASKATWVVVLGMLCYFVLAGFYPNDAPRGLNATWGLSKKVMASIANGLESANENYGKVSAVAGKTSNPNVMPIVVSVPADDVAIISAPQGYRLSSMECPAENVVEIQDPNTGSVLRQIDCAGQITLGENDIYNKEFVIFQKPGGEESSRVTTWWKKV